MLNWDKKFETGHARVDDQHRMLFTYVNELEELAEGTRAFPNGEDIRQYFRFIDFLENYAATHFRDEEECMCRFRCPAHEKNLVAHAEFKNFFREFKNKSNHLGYRLELVRELHGACADWLTKHILKVDIQLKPCQISVDEENKQSPKTPEQ